MVEDVPVFGKNVVGARDAIVISLKATPGIDSAAWTVSTTR